MRTKHFLLAFLALNMGSAIGQSTFDAVNAIFKSNCTIGCHSGATPTGKLDLDGAASAVHRDDFSEAGLVCRPVE